MSKMNKSLETKAAIRKTYVETMQRRKSQDCRVFQIKIDKSKLSKELKSRFQDLFIEAKWFYNYLISIQDLDNFNTNVKEIPVMNKFKEFECRRLKSLSSQMKYGIYKKVLSARNSLNTKKIRGIPKVGDLKFKSIVSSIKLRQFGVTYKVFNNKIMIQGTRKYVSVRGLEQIPKSAEMSMADFLYRGGDFFLRVSCFVPKEVVELPKNCVGIDFGIANTLSMSNGVKVSILQKDLKRVKRIQKKISRSKRVNGVSSHTRNQNKLLLKLNLALGEVKNSKRDSKNKIIHYLKHSFGTIAIQDECVKGWQSGFFGKQINQSCVGELIRGIKYLPQTLIASSRFPSTKQCPKCFKLNKIPLKIRKYSCSCGYSADRDVHAASNILMQLVPTERREFKPVENNTTADMFEYFKKIPNISVSVCSVKQEALDERDMAVHQ